MWLILGGLLVLITLALWWLFNLPGWLTIVIIAVVVLGVGGLYLYRFIAGRRAAKKLEKALADQGVQQANNARPERRAEIQELQKQLQGGINALKTSKLGRGGKSGAAALYTMPWYMIVGPPGAGKTTALKHSGMVFPYGSSSGGGVRGVGGTRNCDWWFTNEAILLDTAGRYTTEQDDRDEWLSFLQFLLKYRSKRPINGILVAISISDLIDATEQQIEITGKKLRQRIDEVMTQLHMVVPVYVLFTKVDLIAGFNEFFGDLRKSDRAQAWGTTLKLDVPKNEPGKLFDAEFDVLLKTLHGRALKRLAGERSREAREKIFQFPLEFAGVKRNLSDLISYTFAVNAFQGTPIFRGFYFTSGTQEGRPLDRVLGRMGQAMGIRTEGQAQQQVVESKSFFLHDVFMNIVFPDGDLAARSAGEVRRRWVMRLAISGAALALALILAIPGVNSALNNNDLMRSTEKLTKQVAKINWVEGNPEDSFKTLDPALERLKQLDDGAKVGYGWMMYQGEKYKDPAKTVYLNKIAEAFIKVEIENLEAELNHVDSEATHYVRNRELLKAYLTLTEPNGAHPNLNVDYATDHFAKTWCDRLKARLGSKELCFVTDKFPTGHIKPHLRYFFENVKANRTTPPPRNEQLVEEARRTLQKIPLRARYYAMFVEGLIEEKYDESGDESYENLVFPPVTLGRIFKNRPIVAPAKGWIFDSRKRQKENKIYEVAGPYTEKGHAVVYTQFQGAEALLKDEDWIVPLDEEEKKPGKILETVKAITDDYQKRFVKEWEGFLDDVIVRSPTDVEETLAILEELTRSDYPFVMLIGAVVEHTQWPNKNPLEGRAGLTGYLNQRLNQKLSSASGGLRFNVDVSKMAAELSFIPERFKKLTTFTTGSAVDGKTTAPDHIRYLDILKDLQKKVSTRKRETQGLEILGLDKEFRDARTAAEALLNANYDQLAVNTLKVYLIKPLTIGARENVVPQDNQPNPPGVPGKDAPKPTIPSVPSWIPKRVP
ncbi:MAG: type VI secretion system membrane subunit TssM [Polyangiaceae bacterium]